MFPFFFLLLRDSSIQHDFIFWLQLWSAGITISSNCRVFYFNLFIYFFLRLFSVSGISLVDGYSLYLLLRYILLLFLFQVGFLDVQRLLKLKVIDFHSRCFGYSQYKINDATSFMGAVTDTLQTTAKRVFAKVCSKIIPIFLSNGIFFLNWPYLLTKTYLLLLLTQESVYRFFFCFILVVRG